MERYNIWRTSRLNFRYLFFNIYLIDLFFLTDNFDLINYADDNTPYSCESSIDKVIVTLDKITEFIFQWVKHNFLKANPDKSHVVLSVNEKRIINITSESIHKISSQT